MDPTTLGVAGALVVVIGYLLVSNRADRAAHRDDAQSLLARIDRLEERIDELVAELDVERDKRRAAEDKASEAIRLVRDRGGLP